MAAYAALVSLLNNIHAVTNHPTLSTSLDNRDMQQLLEKTSFLLDFIESNNLDVDSKEAKDLERQIADAAHAAEDVIESHIVDQILPGTGEASLSCSLHLQQSIQGMDSIMEKIVELKERCELKEEKSTEEAVSTIPKDSGNSAMVGLDAELNQLLDELTGYSSSRQIISIVGMGGSGKTTLANSIYENKLIKEYFQFCAWATISQQNNERQILLQLLSGIRKYDTETVDDLGLELHKALMVRRYLIILDDIWSVEAWEKLNHYFPNNNNRSRILLTTRLSNVAKDCSSTLFMKKLLNEENSWKLFCVKTFENEHCPPELQSVAQEIVKLCKGLALSIVVIGGLLLNSPRTIGYWEDIANNIKRIPNSTEKQKSLDVLSLSYNHLPPHLKPCFLYMGVFREDFDTPASRIVKLWKSNGSRVLEEIAEGYIQDLIDRNLILVGRRRKNGKVGSCRIHDLIRDLCIQVAKQQRFFMWVDAEMRGIERRLVSNEYGEMVAANPLLRTTIEYKYKYTEMMPQYRLLRVFYRNGESRRDHYRKANLRYLAYKCPSNIKMLKLPTSIPLIWNLQFLFIEMSGGSSLVVAPTELWKMQQLKHMQSESIYLPHPPPSYKEDGKLVLENLQTLKRAVNLRLSEEVCDIIPNIKKLHLLYDPDSQGYDDSLIGYLCNLVRLHKLESLHLSIYRDAKLIAKISPSFPSFLNKLSLWGCNLPWDDMRLIGSLPQLEVLKLGRDAFDQGSWFPVTGQFLRLKFLEISHCDLNWLDADDSHFPVLQKLILGEMLLLQSIPMEFGDIPTLQHITVRFCNEEIAISAVKLKEDQLENEDLTVEVFLHQSFLKFFKEGLETEGLTTNNIQFICYH